MSVPVIMGCLESFLFIFTHTIGRIYIVYATEKQVRREKEQNDNDYHLTRLYTSDIVVSEIRSNLLGIKKEY